MSPTEKIHFKPSQGRSIRSLFLSIASSNKVNTGQSKSIEICQLVHQSVGQSICQFMSVSATYVIDEAMDKKGLS